MFTRKIRVTGETLTVGTAVELGVDPEAGKWVTICEDHHTIANSATQSLAYYTHGRDFCDGCRADFEGTPAPAPAGPDIKLTFATGEDTKVHAATCADLKKAATKRAAHNGFHTLTFPAGTDERAVWLDHNDDFLSEGGAEAAWELTFLPCCHEAGLIKNPDRTWSE